MDVSSRLPRRRGLDQPRVSRPLPSCQSTSGSEPRLPHLGDGSNPAEMSRVKDRQHARTHPPRYARRQLGSGVVEEVMALAKIPQGRSSKFPTLSGWPSASTASSRTSSHLCGPRTRVPRTASDQGQEP